MNKKNNIKVIISGGGTGGHIFPALSIADEIKKRLPKTDILFVGAEDRMEMERIPAAGYKIIGLPVKGLIRKVTFRNIKVILDFFKSRRKAKEIIEDFNPDIAIGVGGYASAPLINAASVKKIPCVLQEQNSYAGITNKMLSKKVDRICVAYDGMERFFPKNKIINTGNPVRNLIISQKLKDEGKKYFKIETDYPVLFVMGGSLGARTINSAMLAGINELAKNKIEVIWQTGKYYIDSIKKELKNLETSNIRIMDFISRMDLAYNVSDLVIGRAGALSLSELCLIGKPSILVPSPNVAEDHQTKNALSLVNKDAARIIKDFEANEKLISESLKLLGQKDALRELGLNALKLAKPNATATIVDEIFKLIADKNV